MSKDFLRELEYLGITARLKRMSDSISYSIKELYKIENVDIEPSWHLVFLILKKHKTRTMTEISEAFNISQPAMARMIEKIIKKGYINTIEDKTDKRKKQLQLSKKAIKELSRFEKVWNAGQKSIRDMLKGNKEFFGSLEKFEQQLDKIDFKERTLNYLRND